MNDLTRISTPNAAILSLALSAPLRHHVERLLEPPTGFPRPAVSEVHRLEAEKALAAVGPLRAVGLNWFDDWLAPLFLSA